LIIKRNFCLLDAFLQLARVAEGFDFEVSMNVSFATNGPEISEVVGALPPITLSSDGTAPNGRSHATPNISSDDVDEIEVDLAVVTRDRGLSFELFSFGVNEDEASLLHPDILSNGRPRGDSIIFDPLSFSDGGIHEANALLKSRKHSLDLGEPDEIEIMNTSGFVETASLR